MPTSTLTTKGQITIPKPVRDLLRLETGDLVDFIVEADGRIYVQAGRVDVRALQGMLKVPGRKPVTLAAMDDAIAFARQRHP
jgi:antitoxin PrlF